ncbi:MAG: hypothetical protein ACUVWX_10330, partial [Kiritimatiellia bacterium]
GVTPRFGCNATGAKQNECALAGAWGDAERETRPSAGKTESPARPRAAVSRRNRRTLGLLRSYNHCKN